MIICLNGPKTPGYIRHGLPRCFEIKASLWFNRPVSSTIDRLFSDGPTEEAFDEQADYERQHRLTARDLGVGRFA